MKKIYVIILRLIFKSIKPEDSLAPCRIGSRFNFAFNGSSKFGSILFSSTSSSMVKLRCLAECTCAYIYIFICLCMMCVIGSFVITVCSCSCSCVRVCVCACVCVCGVVIVSTKGEEEKPLLNRIHVFGLMKKKTMIIALPFSAKCHFSIKNVHQTNFYLLFVACISLMLQLNA